MYTLDLQEYASEKEYPSSVLVWNANILNSELIKEVWRWSKADCNLFCDWADSIQDGIVSIKIDIQSKTVHWSLWNAFTNNVGDLIWNYRHQQPKPERYDLNQL